MCIRDSRWRVDDHIPALYAKTVIDKIFDNIGYTYTSDSFFNTDRFKRLVLPYQYGAISESASGATNRLFQAQISGSTTLNAGDVIPFSNDSTGGNFDNGGNWDNTTYKYTAPASARYSFTIEIELPSNTQLLDVELDILVNGSKITTAQLYYQANQLVSQDTIILTLQSGDELQVQYRSIFGILTSLGVTANCFIYNATASNLLGYDNTIDFSQFFSGEYTQKDLLLNFVKMFNLYIEDTESKELRIVPRDEFYDGDNVDWSDKLDYSQPTQVIPMGDLQSNPYVFTYKDTDDIKNKEYKEQYDQVYGQNIVRIDNDFVKSEKKIEVTFSPTPLVEAVGTTRYYSWIPKDDANFRVLYYGGAVTTSAYYTFDQNPSTANTTKYP